MSIKTYSNESLVSERVLDDHLLPSRQLLLTVAAHKGIELVPHETLIDGAIARPHIGTELLAVVAAREIERPVEVKVIGLQLDDPSNLHATLFGELVEFER